MNKKQIIKSEEACWALMYYWLTAKFWWMPRKVKHMICDKARNIAENHAARIAAYETETLPTVE